MENSPSFNGRLLRLEAVRGLAAFYVVLHHTLPHVYIMGGFNVGIAFKFGQEAVILFFLLSGFVINYSYRLGSDKSFKRYFKSRFFRIYIPLVLVFAISYFSVSYNAGSLQNVDFKTLLGNIFMLQDWSFARPNVIVEAYMDNGPLWSLSYEWWFYMLFFPIVNSKISLLSRDRLVYGACLVAAVLYLFYPYFFVRVWMYLAIWWTGVRLADAYLEGSLNHFKSNFLTVFSLGAVVAVLAVNVYLQRLDGVALTLGRHPIIEFRHFLFALIAVIAALVLNRTSWKPFDLVTRPFLVLAPISYVLYIVHVPLARNAEYLDFVANPQLRWAGYIIVCLVVSYLIEIKFYPAVKSRLLSNGKR